MSLKLLDYKETIMPFTKHSEFFDRYASLIATYSSSGVGENNILGQLSIAQQDSLTVAYAPFDHVPLHADLVIVGITPGHTQAINAIASASIALRWGIRCNEATFLEYIKNPRARIPDTKMVFPGIKTETEAKDLWAYLKQFGADGKKK